MVLAIFELGRTRSSGRVGGKKADRVMDLSPGTVRIAGEDNELVLADISVLTSCAVSRG